MHEQDIEAFIAQLWEAWNRGDESSMLSMIAPNATYHTALGSSEDWRSSMQQLHRDFPDLKYTLQNVVIDANRQLSVAYVTCEGTAPDKRRVSWREMRMARWRDGLVTEVWMVSDRHVVLGDG